MISGPLVCDFGADGLGGNRPSHFDETNSARLVKEDIPSAVPSEHCIIDSARIVNACSPWHQTIRHANTDVSSLTPSDPFTSKLFPCHGVLFFVDSCLLMPSNADPLSRPQNSLNSGTLIMEWFFHRIVQEWCSPEPSVPDID